MVEVKYKMNIFLYLTVFYDVLSFTLSLLFPLQRYIKFYKSTIGGIAKDSCVAVK